MVERKNMIFIEVARSMLSENSLPMYFWAKAMSTTCYVLKQVNVRKNLNITFYEIMKGKTSKTSRLHFFGLKCYMLNNSKSNPRKFDSKPDAVYSVVTPLL